MTNLSDWGKSLTGAYPDPKQWPKYQSDWKSDVFRFSRLWLTEGIPYAFRDQPIVFEYAREQLGQRLQTSPKNLSLVGSARTGFSFNPASFGSPYSRESSDLDLFLVSSEWFRRLVSEFEQFASRYRSGLEVPRNPSEAKYFHENVEEGPKSIVRGFINQWRIPNFDRYVRTREIHLAADGFRRDLNRHLDTGHEIRRVSIRSYRDWEAAISQIGGSTLSCLKVVADRM